MGWNFAVHTISWVNHSLEEILNDVQTAGYQGVELFQHPDELGGTEKILECFGNSDIQLIGVASGSFDDRCQLVRDIASNRNVPLQDPSLPYVYCDEWRMADPRYEAAVKEGFRIALHPHMYKPVQTLQEALEILEKYPQVGFLPDTAHLQISGEIPAKVIEDHMTELIGIHLKSWREDVGRSYQFYARGFCELGEGDVDLESVLRMVLRKRFSGWLVVEQNSTVDPLQSAIRSLKLLKQRLTRESFEDI